MGFGGFFVYFPFKGATFISNLNSLLTSSIARGSGICLRGCFGVFSLLLRSLLMPFMMAREGQGGALPASGFPRKRVEEQGVPEQYHTAKLNCASK